MSSVLLALGGLGLFLIGMQVLTEGLRGLAGRSLRRLLVSFTRTPASGALTGALSTAIVQSSSATTVTAVGFVSAGLLTFPQALGIIFGANIGTTITGWIVALIGFKLQLTQVVMPLIFIGALLKLFGRGRVKSIGWAVAGFSLLFIGIEGLQQGLAAFEGVVTPQSFPADTLWGRFQLVIIGILITLVTQSSSAGVATALVALGTGAISFPQAAALVIGMDVGTTFTAAIATLGGSTSTRRTGYAHVIYNCLTGLMAFALLTPYSALVIPLLSLDNPGDAQIAVVAFHTLFNGLGVLVIIGFTHQFARLIERLVPERGPNLVGLLDEGLLTDSNAALDAAQGSIRKIALAAFDYLDNELQQCRGASDHSTQSLKNAIETAYVYVSTIGASAKDAQAHQRLQTLLHLLDHLSRLIDRASDQDRLQAITRLDSLDHEKTELLNALGMVQQDRLNKDQVQSLNRLRKELRERRHSLRASVFEATAGGGLDADVTSTLTDGIRWLHRVAYHIWRIGYYLELAQFGEHAEDIGPAERLYDLSEDDDGTPRII